MPRLCVCLFSSTFNFKKPIFIHKAAMLSDEELLALYHKPDWPGSFSGVRVFKMMLYTDFNEDVSEK